MMIKGNQAAVKGLPSRSSKADNKKRICDFCIHTGQPEDRRAIEVNMLIQQLLEYWLRPLDLPCLRLQTLPGDGLPPMTWSTKTQPFDSIWEHSEGPRQVQNF